MKRISPTELERIKRLAGKVSDVDLAHRFGFSRTRVQQIRVSLGIAAAPKMPPPIVVRFLTLNVPPEDLVGPIGETIGRAVSREEVRNWQFQAAFTRQS